MKIRLDNQVCFNLYVLSKEIIKKYKPYLDPLNLTYTQYLCMLVLWEKKEVNVKELGEKIYLDSGTLTPLLKRLQNSGYINRHRDSHDERNVLISLTQKGIELESQISIIPSKMCNCMLLDEEERETLKRISSKIMKY